MAKEVYKRTQSSPTRISDDDLKIESVFQPPFLDDSEEITVGEDVKAALAATMVDGEYILLISQPDGTYKVIKGSGDAQTLQTVTDDGNSTTNAIQVTGSGNLDLEKTGFFVAYDEDNSAVTLGYIKDGVSVSFLEFTKETPENPGLSVSSRMAGNPAINASDFVTKNQLDSAVPKSATKNITGTAYTLISEDVNKWLVFDNAATITVTVPAGLFTEGVSIKGRQKGEGQVQFVGASGIELVTAIGELPQMAEQGGVFELHYESATDVAVFGRLVLV